MTTGGSLFLSLLKLLQPSKKFWPFMRPACCWVPAPHKAGTMVPYNGLVQADVAPEHDSGVRKIGATCTHTAYLGMPMHSERTASTPAACLCADDTCVLSGMHGMTRSDL